MEPLPSHRTAGVTLVELALVVATVATLAAIAVPRFVAAREAAHAGAAHQAMLGSLMAATSHASSTGAEVVVCPGDANGCRPTHDWTGGWVVFADIDGDRVRDPHDTLLQRVAPLGGNARLRSTPGRTRIVFQPNGGAAGSNVTFTLCDGRGAARATALVMNNGAHLRATPAQAAAADACMRAL
ncbi:GspH/FimT family pseudopilin [Lysobacter sp. KIS68-7]|uniref:GspH/FimT family pseudopilin n=1 Tax=Lysobacter sp. KIS68-7 TaxID=2904252 RepID=UPI001E585EAE|nr:GspH/FimT family pseudopilin [Lysobacter sp. KIS68-7]UHQ19608.1 GspH/FimT family pseudopilin [Lysobacter sp. KIS68-7]